MNVKCLGRNQESQRLHNLHEVPNYTIDAVYTCHWNKDVHDIEHQPLQILSSVYRCCPNHNMDADQEGMASQGNEQSQKK